jgi:putative membrane protein insertion efficiency factor
MARLLIGLIGIYRLTFSAILGRSCRFLPTCSEYAEEALRKHGAARGSWLALRRIARCHPWGGSGFDPVPDEWPPK